MVGRGGKSKKLKIKQQKRGESVPCAGNEREGGGH